MLPGHAITGGDRDRIKDRLPTRGPANDARLFVDAVLFVARNGITWRDLPARLGLGARPGGGSTGGPGQASGGG